MTARTRIGASPALAVGIKKTTLCCSFTTDADGDPSTITDGCASEGVDSVTRTAEGVYAVTLGRQYGRVFWADAKAYGATDTDANAWQYTSTANTAGHTVVTFTHYTGGAAADINSADVRCVIVVKGR